MNSPHVAFVRDIYQTIGASILVTSGVTYLYKSFFSTKGKSKHTFKPKFASYDANSLNVDVYKPQVSDYVSCEFYYRGYRVKWCSVLLIRFVCVLCCICMQKTRKFREKSNETCLFVRCLTLIVLIFGQIKAIGLRTKFRKAKFLKDEICQILLVLMKKNIEITLKNILRNSDYTIRDLYISLVCYFDTCLRCAF